MKLHVTPKRFRAMRKEMQFTQAQIANWFGVQVLSVTRWETNRSPIPGSAKILMWLLYEEQIKGNKRAMRTYLERFAPHIAAVMPPRFSPRAL